MMLEKYGWYIARWPMVYVMAGLCLIGVICMIVSGMYGRSLVHQVVRLRKGKPLKKRSVTKRLVENYTMHLQKDEKIKDVDQFIEGELVQEKVFGISVYELENINLAMMVACFTMGSLGSLTAFLNGALDQEIVFIFTVGLCFTGIGVLFEVLFRSDYHRMYYLLGMQNFLCNDIRFQFERNKQQKEDVEQARKERTKKLLDNKRKQEQITSDNQAETPVLEEELEQIPAAFADMSVEDGSNTAQSQAGNVKQSLNVKPNAMPSKESSQQSADAKDIASNLAFSNSSSSEQLAAALEQCATHSRSGQVRTGDRPKTAIDNELLEDILRNLLMDND